MRKGHRLSTKQLRHEVAERARLAATPLVLLALLLGADLISAAPAHAQKSDPLEVHTVNYPLSYFAKRIGGDAVSVHFPELPGDPAYWEPDATTLAAYQSADLVLLNGAGYARWIERASLRRKRLVNTSKGFEDRWIRSHDTTTHSHGPDGEHAHTGFAFTTWLNPAFSIEQARSIAEAFEKARPDSTASFRANLAKLIADLEGLDTALRATTDEIGDQPLLFSHPVYAYLEARYGLNGQSVHFEPDVSPSDDALRALEALRATHRSRWMVWEARPLAESIARLEKLGIESVVFDPVGNRPESGDYLEVMRANLRALETIAKRSGDADPSDSGP